MEYGAHSHYFAIIVPTTIQSMTLRDAQILTLRVLKQVMEEKLDHHNVQLAQVKLLRHILFRYIFNRACIGNEGRRV
jgi:hypothetical protein